MAYEHYWDIDEDEEKLAVSRKEFARAAKELGGQVKERLDDDEIWVTGHYDGRPFRVKMDVDMGHVEVEVKVKNGLGVLVVQFNPEKGGGTGKDEDRDEWDDDDNRMAKHFLAPGIFLEEMPDEIEPMKTLLGQHPDVQQRLVQVMPKERFDRVRVDSDVAVVHSAADIIERDMVLTARAALSTIAWLAGTFEAGDVRVAEKPNVYFGGKPAATGTTGTLVTCAFCGQLVPLDATRHCPNCGASN